jgi:hypothetical protein
VNIYNRENFNYEIHTVDLKWFQTKILCFWFTKVEMLEVFWR